MILTAEPGPDGRLRCPWALGTPEYLDYHDTEWAVPVTSVAGLFERLSLEAFQSGLAWITILRKREAFRAAFQGFDPDRVAAFGETEVERLMADKTIVRNRAKITATVANARVVAGLGEEFARIILRYAEPDHPRPTGTGDVRASSPGSVAMAKELKAAGLRFVGPTTAYALMQAVGLVDDHLVDCFVPPRTS
ncbi:MAG TPA: DNA-3-methyladenine glycosylase I [Propionibacteriaceae bacterium]|jgi:DNA-3-methyladenine glycosylase I|nr:DNA-3-methyladenine glycosylase I [Propionibacteriaceae bacterium]